jgi:hypothetical protein
MECLTRDLRCWDMNFPQSQLVHLQEQKMKEREEKEENERVKAWGEEERKEEMVIMEGVD